MDLFQSGTYSFVVKIWLEETAEEAGDVLWRGQITHVPSGARRYFNSLDDLLTIIVSYLQAEGQDAGSPRKEPMSIFSFLRDQPDTSANSVADSPAPRNAVTSLMTITHGAPAQGEILTNIKDALSFYLPPRVGSLPDPNVSIIHIEEKPAGLGSHIGDEMIGQFSLALKAGRLLASVRFQLWANSPNDVDQAIDDLHGRLLAAKDDLWILGFLRCVAVDSPPAEHVPSLPAWRRTADYEVLYEFRYVDADDAQSLIARIPIHSDLEELNAPERETSLLTDEMIRWDDQSAPALDLRGRLTVSQFSALSYVPGTTPTGPVMLLRTFNGASGPPSAFPDLGQFVTAVTDLTSPVRHAQTTFATFGDFLAAFSPDGDPIELGDWEENNTPDSYQPLLLDLPSPIVLPDWTDHLQLVYQPGSSSPLLDQTAILYIRAGRP